MISVTQGEKKIPCSPFSYLIRKKKKVEKKDVLILYDKEKTSIIHVYYIYIHTHICGFFFLSNCFGEHI